MGERSGGDALSLILHDDMCLLRPKMPPLGAQGTPATRCGHRLPSSGDRLAGGPHPRNSSEEEAKKEKNPILFLPRAGWFGTEEMSEPGTGLRDSSEPQR